MIQIYHNPRCRKSREGLAILENVPLTNGIDFEIIKYLEKPLSAKELKEILKKIGIKPIDLVRTKEAVWKEKFKGKELSDDDIIQAMASYPKLIERPIVVNANKAVLGRPAELIKKIL